MPMRSGLFLPLSDELANPAVVARLSAEAEKAGWHGVFVWDHVRWREPVEAVADPWITLAAVAAATGHVRLGPMVTPLARRAVWWWQAREGLARRAGVRGVSRPPWR